MNKTLVSAFCIIIVMFTAVVWSAPVPDTGQTLCYNVAGDVITCPLPGQPLYGQDANYSINPMSFTKLDGSGNELSSSATSWVTVKDNVTGLVWEMKNSKDDKTDYSNPHDADNIYTWYDSNPATNGGNAGTPGTGTDTEDFIKALNGANYGGYNDWRMPTIKELAYIVNYSILYSGPTIDTGYFPNTAASWYWSSTTYANNTYNAWPVNFNYGYANLDDKLNNTYVRAVRGGQPRPFGPSVISVSPASRAVAKDAGATTFSVSNTGTGTMPWIATVTSGDSWLLISGAIGTNSGTISCSFTTNTSTSARTGTIRVTASGATGSPKDVTVIQVPTGCTATLDGKLMLHIPALSYLNPYWGAPSFWASFVYEYNPAYPALILFKMTNAGIITAPTFSCKTSETSTLDDLKIHIPGLLLSDGITHLSVDMEYSAVFSVNGNTYFVVTKYGVVS